MSAVPPAPELDEVARHLLGPGARWLAQGATCTVYTDGVRVARLAHGAAHLRTQVQLQRALRDWPVVPVLEAGTLPEGTAYSLEPYTAGDGRLPTAAGWADLGRTLAALHALPHRGYGLLLGAVAPPWTGSAPTPAAGLLTRLTHGGGLDRAGLSAHPLVGAAPGLLPPLLAHWDAVLDTVGGPCGVLHTDLGAGNLCWHGGRLRALLDFGDAAVGPVVWDVASVAYFHGWPAAERVAEAANISDLPGAARFGLLLALHRAGRAAVRGQSTARAVAFAEGCLERLGG